VAQGENMDVSGKVFVVTGGGNGIARELVLQLLEKGATVAAIDLSATGLAETKKLAGSFSSNLSTHTLNITDRAKVMALPKAVIAKHGRVDALVNVAGIIQPFVRVNDLDFEAIERVINVNLYGTINTIKAFLPELLTRPEGYIANVSSMGGYAPVPGQTIYGATKAAVKLLTEGLHSELKGTNVHVTAIYPGAIATNIAQNSGMAMPANMDPHEANKFPTTPAPEAARIIIDAIEKNAYKVFIGKDAKTMDRLTRLMPQKAAELIYNNMKSLLG
jgi:NAD(P)-dependent dehydrogenase (short-subunit alcohol dehydrogenase family)